MRALVRRQTWIGIAVFATVSLGVAFVLGLVQEGEPAQRAPLERAAPADVFRSATLLPVSDGKALGYSNNSRFLVDANGGGWIAVRSKYNGEYGICLVRAATPWRTGMSTTESWLQDRDSLQIAHVPQRAAAIAAGTDGSIHMVWYGGVAASAEHQVHYARFSTSPATRLGEAGTPFTVPGFRAVAAVAESPMELWQEHAAIALGPDGTAHVVWEARDPFRRTEQGMPKPGIAYATRSPGGVWSASGTLDRPPYLQVNERYGSQSRPAILVDTSSLVHVVCYGAVGGVQQILHGTTVGRGFSGWKPIAPSSGDQRHVAAALDASGRLHVAWREGTTSGGAASIAIFYSVRDIDGRWHKPVRLSGAEENASTPSVGVTDSAVSVAWVAWSPGALNSENQVDNGFPADNSTVEGRLEVSSSPLGHERFSPALVLDRGAASYPCWAIGGAGGTTRPALVWTSREAGGGNALKLGWSERAH